MVGDLATAIEFEASLIKLPVGYPSDHCDFGAFANCSLRDFPASSRIFRYLSLQDVPEKCNELLFRKATAAESSMCVLAWLARFHPEVFEYQNGAIPRALAKVGSMNGMMLLKESGILDQINANILEDAALAGHIHVLEFLEKNGPFVFSPAALNAAAKSGSLETLAYVHDRVKTMFKLWKPFRHAPDFKKSIIITIAIEKALQALQPLSASSLFKSLMRLQSRARTVWFSPDFWSDDSVSKNVEMARCYVELGVPKWKIADNAPKTGFEDICNSLCLSPNDTNDQVVWHPVMSRAIKFGHLPIVKALIENGVKVVEKFVYVALASGRLEIFKTLLRHSEKENLVRCLTSDTALLSASVGGSIPIAQFLLSLVDKPRGAHVAMAARAGHLPLVKFLLARLPDNDKPFAERSAIIEQASAGGNLETVTYLCEELRVVTISCMIAAARYGHLSVIQYLHKRSSGKLRAKDQMWSAAFTARKLDVMKFLHKEGYAFNQDPAFYADLESIDMAKFLFFTCGVDVEHQIINFSAEKGDVEHLRSFHERTLNPPPDLPNLGAWQAVRIHALHCAVEMANMSDQLDALSYLCENGYADSLEMDLAGSLRTLRYAHGRGSGMQDAVVKSGLVDVWMRTGCLGYFVEKVDLYWTDDALMEMARLGCLRELKHLKLVVLGLPKKKLQKFMGFLRLLTAAAIAIFTPLITIDVSASSSDLTSRDAASTLNSNNNNVAAFSSNDLVFVEGRSLIPKRKRKPRKKKSKNGKLKKKTSCPFVRRGGKGASTRPRGRLGRRTGGTTTTTTGGTAAPHTGTCGDVHWAGQVYISRDIYISRGEGGMCLEYHPGTTEGCNDLVQPFHDEVRQALDHLNTLPSFHHLLSNMRHKVVIRGVVHAGSELIAEAVPGDHYGVAHGFKCKFNKGDASGVPVQGGGGATVFLSVGFHTHCKASTKTLFNNKRSILDVPGYITLGHELVHATRITHGLGPDFGMDKVTQKNFGHGNEEFLTVGGGDPLPTDGSLSGVGATENSLRHDAGLGLRMDYTTFNAKCTHTLHQTCK
ncbi:hypothetical protein HDU97_002922 [Phlyctochytrium planicorne]|nr:hypothetical protein HDU97_002922 [Phlyctochytrium planicorne]